MGSTSGWDPGHLINSLNQRAQIAGLGTRSDAVQRLLRLVTQDSKVPRDAPWVSDPRFARVTRSADQR